MAMESTRTEERLRNEFPLHWLVWHNDHDALAALLHERHDIEHLDPRGRTALMLAVTLGHITCARSLLAHGADANCENNGWTVAQEAVARGDPELVRLVIHRRELQRQRTRASGIPRLLQRLRDAPDFYVEMRWEFASWVPLVSRLCPSDTYRVYKRGANVRVDTTLLGFEQSAGNWQRGSRSYMFRGEGDGCTLLEVDHDAKQVIVEEMIDAENDMDLPDMGDYLMDCEVISRRMTTPIVATYVDTERIAFERNKSSSLLGALWRSSGGAERTENVAGHECRVFSATNVQLVTKTRTEHLPQTVGGNNTAASSPLQSLLTGGTVTTQQVPQDSMVCEEESNGEALTAVEYFTTQRGDILLRPKRLETRVQRFKATLWLAADYPLSLPEQVLPIVDLMATSSPHFAKLRDFIRLQLPSGFPVKIEIPLFHVLNARITFANIFAKDSPAEHVSNLTESTPDGEHIRLTCVVDDAAFEAPPSYTVIGGAAGGATGSDMNRSGVSHPQPHHHLNHMDEQDELLQFAIQQSLLDAASAGGAGSVPDSSREEVDIWEALRYDNAATAKAALAMGSDSRRAIGEEERQLQRAIQASLSLDPTPSNTQIAVNSTDTIEEHQDLDEIRTVVEDDLIKAIRLSAEERRLEEERIKQEERELEEIIKLSLTEM